MSADSEAWRVTLACNRIEAELLEILHAVVVGVGDVELRLRGAELGAEAVEDSQLVGGQRHESP